jgi:hypothetical protein
VTIEIDLDIPAPPDATELFDWLQHGPDLARRPFTGTVREVAGFVVRIEGIQRDNQRCTRQVVVDAESVETRMESEAVRQLADWALETRRNARTTARRFFLWAYKTKRIPVHIADDLPVVREIRGRRGRRRITCGSKLCWQPLRAWRSCCGWQLRLVCVAARSR